MFWNTNCTICPRVRKYTILTSTLKSELTKATIPGNPVKDLIKVAPIVSTKTSIIPKTMIFDTGINKTEAQTIHCQPRNNKEAPSI